MTTVALATSAPGTLADLHERLGHIPLQRIRCQPAPGTATEADVLMHFNGEKRLCELVDGVLAVLPGFQLPIRQWLARAGRRRKHG